jgi:predicted NBD/HSP70 family sugar kinase
MNTTSLLIPQLDPGFLPAAMWNRAYRHDVASAETPQTVTIALQRPDGSCSHYTTQILPLTPETQTRTYTYIERILKFLLWQRGGSTIWIAGCDPITKALAATYAPSGTRAFDADFFGAKLYGRPLSINACTPSDLPAEQESSVPLGRHLDGCRIGFDLGGSDRKCAALIDGKVVFSEEIAWDPYFEKDPEYHIAGIQNTLERAASHLPRVDAIGGSAAGVYINNEVRVASLFRGVSPEAFEKKVRRIFFDLKERWNNIPFDVVNDGEVTALAGSMSLQQNGVLGLSMGTSQAVGYVTPEGTITPWLNELAFAPVDYRNEAPVDEWSGDNGCGVQYFSQQAVARLAPMAGFSLDPYMPYPQQLEFVHERMGEGDERAARIYETIGNYLGHSLAHYSDFYAMTHILLLGRVTSGEGGSIIIETADRILAHAYPELAGSLAIHTPNEKDKRHGQAVAAASLPAIGA